MLRSSRNNTPTSLGEAAGTCCQLTHRPEPKSTLSSPRENAASSSSFSMSSKATQLLQTAMGSVPRLNLRRRSLSLLPMHARTCIRAQRVTAFHLLSFLHLLLILLTCLSAGRTIERGPETEPQCTSVVTEFAHAACTKTQRGWLASCGAGAREAHARSRRY
jgi:hypothetical protein